MPAVAVERDMQSHGRGTWQKGGREAVVLGRAAFLHLLAGLHVTVVFCLSDVV